MITRKEIEGAINTSVNINPDGSLYFKEITLDPSEFSVDFRFQLSRYPQHELDEFLARNFNHAAKSIAESYIKQHMEVTRIEEGGDLVTLKCQIRLMTDHERNHYNRQIKLAEERIRDYFNDRVKSQRALKVYTQMPIWWRLIHVLFPSVAKRKYLKMYQGDQHDINCIK